MPSKSSLKGVFKKWWRPLNLHRRDHSAMAFTLNELFWYWHDNVVHRGSPLISPSTLWSDELCAFLSKFGHGWRKHLKNLRHVWCKRFILTGKPSIRKKKSPRTWALRDKWICPLSSSFFLSCPRSLGLTDVWRLDSRNGKNKSFSFFLQLRATKITDWTSGSEDT